MLLHTLNKPEALAPCLKLLSPGDQLVLIEDGIYTAVDDLLEAGTVISALAVDLKARGFADRLAPEVSVIDYAELVQLAVKADRIFNWF